MAKKAAAYDLRVISIDYVSRRKDALRKLDISKWARMVKPTMRVSHGFTASWYTPSDGPPRKPATSKEACEGALQEWSKLMIEPPNKLSTPLITPYTYKYYRPRKL